MRTTVRLDDDLLAAVKKYAIETNRTLTAVIEDALRQHMAQKEVLQLREPVHLYTVQGRGTQPGVDLDDSAALLDLMEESDGPF